MIKHIFHICMISILSCLSFGAFATLKSIEIHSASKDIVPPTGTLSGYTLWVGYDIAGVQRMRIFFGKPDDPHNKIEFYIYDGYWTKSDEILFPEQIVSESLDSKGFEELNTAFNKLPENPQSAMRTFFKGERIQSPCKMEVKYLDANDQGFRIGRSIIKFGSESEKSKIVSIALPRCD